MPRGKKFNAAEIHFKAKEKKINDELRKYKIMYNELLEAYNKQGDTNSRLIDQLAKLHLQEGTTPTIKGPMSISGVGQVAAIQKVAKLLNEVVSCGEELTFD